ncbi:MULTISPECIES: PilZ domain-containing protein [unclassified Sphingomonas]|jgi:hypothetical protein|uniref:PilZ domain-containing protein n=1 Tax=unclassified Sphingomonas TaxID=196159 RepID=UPI001F576472|nr:MULTISPECIES: PilZ domain-containing protein [unclassified Sphingomonas]
MIGSTAAQYGGSASFDERRAERHQLRLTRTATTSLIGDFVVILSNLSRTGVLIETPVKLRPGSAVAITIDGAMIFVGAVTWCGYGFAGLEFANPVLNEVVDYIVAISKRAH